MTSRRRSQPIGWRTFDVTTFGRCSKRFRPMMRFGKRSAYRTVLAGGSPWVAGFHLFITGDPADPQPGALVVFGIDVWLDDFPN